MLERVSDAGRAGEGDSWAEVAAEVARDSSEGDVPWDNTPGGKYKPRDYQEAVMSEAMDALQQHESCLIVMATGLGKTICFNELARRWPAELGRVLIVAHREKLIHQAADKLLAHTDVRPGIEMGALRDFRNTDWQTKYLVGSVQSLQNTKRLNMLDLSAFGLIIYDEAHHCRAPGYHVITESIRRANPKVRVLGVTATPKRGDDKALSESFEVHTAPRDIVWGIENGWLCDVVQRKVYVSEIQLSRVHTRGGDLVERELETEMLGGSKEKFEGVLTPEQEEQRAKRLTILHKIAKPLVDESAGRQGIVFTPGVLFSKELTDVLNSGTYPGVRAAHVDGSTPEEERADTLAAADQGEIQFICNCAIYTEGFDAPWVKVVAVARPTKQTSMYLQMVGRGTRPLEGTVDGIATAEARIASIAASAKPHMLLLDFAGNAGSHSLISGCDILCGEAMTPEERDIIEKLIAGGAMSVRAAQKIAKAELQKKRDEAAERRKREDDERRAKQARVEIESCEYDTEEFGYDGGRSNLRTNTSKQPRGDATDKQVALLVKLGISKEFAETCSKRQAGKIIDKKASEIKANSGDGADYRLSWGKHAGKKLSEVPSSWVSFVVENNYGNPRALAELSRQWNMFRGVPAAMPEPTMAESEAPF